MTVKEVIAILQQLENFEVKLMIDCPHCGYSKEVKSITKIVLISGKEEKKIGEPERN